MDRLDRALVNDAWTSTFPPSPIYRLPRIKSDPRPILLKTNPSYSSATGRPFRFLVGWTKHAKFPTFVRDAWKFLGDMVHSISNFTNLVKEWNKLVYGFIGTRKKSLMNSLSHIHKALDRSSLDRLAQLEADVRDEPKNLLDHEELLWGQKTRCDWLQFSDQNTEFFHSRTVRQRKFNFIHALRNENGESCLDQEVLQDEAVQYFENLYGERTTPIRGLSTNLFPCFNSQDIAFLSRVITEEEIKKALFDMTPLKAPGIDSFHAHFF